MVIFIVASFPIDRCKLRLVVCFMKTNIFFNCLPSFLMNYINISVPFKKKNLEEYCKLWDRDFDTGCFTKYVYFGNFLVFLLMFCISELYSPETKNTMLIIEFPLVSQPLTDDGPLQALLPPWKIIGCGLVT